MFQFKKISVNTLGFLLILNFILISKKANGIDPHFSQYYASPLTLNPSLTGLSYGNFRFSTNYRNQWRSITPFKTYSVSFDMAISPNKYTSNFFGTGILIKNDISANNLRYSNIMGSLSYHKSIGTNNFLAFGFQGGMVQKKSEIASLSYDKQWIPLQGHDPGISNGENLGDENIFYPDFNAGMLWYSFIGKSSSIFSGISIFHITEPKESFLNTNNTLSRRYLFHTGGRFTLNNNFSFQPNIIVMRQNAVNEINIGSGFEYNFSKKDNQNTISFGAWYRLQDAIILVTSLKYDGFKLGFSYDVNISGLRNLTKSKGGFEITLNYTFKKPMSKSTHIPSSTCPRL